jgi:hypothetical protein
MSVLRRYCVGAFVGLAIVGFASSSAAQDVPSGQSITLHEVLIDAVDNQSWLRFRFIAPRIARVGGDITYGDAAADMEHLCASVAVPYMSEYELQSDLVVISLSDQETEFGTPNQDATQFLDAFRVKNMTCIWEAF